MQKNITRAVLKERLNTLPGLLQLERRMDRNKVEEIHRVNSEIRCKFLSEVFGGRTVNCHITTDFVVMCQDMDDVAQVKAQLKSMGFKNVHTYHPLIHAGGTESRRDPENPYAVNVSSVDDLIIAKTAEKHMQILKNALQPLIDDVCFIYAYGGQISVRFGELASAQALDKFLKEVFSRADEEKAFSGSSLIRPHSLDTWTVDYQLKP